MTRCGIDLVEVSRIRQSAEKNPRFVTRVFGDLERELFHGAIRYQRMAAHFAAKEAFSKALGTGLRGFSLAEVQVLRDEWGAPFLRLSGAAAERAKGWRFSVSLTHTEAYAQAVVLAEETEKGGMIDADADYSADEAGGAAGGRGGAFLPADDGKRRPDRV